MDKAKMVLVVVASCFAVSALSSCAWGRSGKVSISEPSPVSTIPRPTEILPSAISTSTPSPSKTKVYSATPTHSSTPTSTVSPTSTSTHTASPTHTATTTSTPSQTPTPRPPSSTHTPTSTHTASPPTPTPTLEIEAGWTLYERDDEGGRFAIAIPPSWQLIDTRPDQVETSVQEFRDQNSHISSVDLDAYINSLAYGGWVLFLAFDVSPEATATGLNTFAMIGKNVHMPDSAWDEIASQTIQSLMENNAALIPESISHRQFSLQNHDAVLIQYEEDLSGSYDTNWLFVIPGVDETYWLLLTADTVTMMDYEDVFPKIAQSFRIIE